MKLYSQFGNNLTPEQCAEYDDLDRIRAKAMKKAEKLCRKLHMGAIAWSPEMQYTRHAIQYIKLTIRKKKGRKVSARFLIRLSHHLGMNFVHMSINALEKEIQYAYHIYNQQKKRSKRNETQFFRLLGSII